MLLIEQNKSINTLKIDFRHEIILQDNISGLKDSKTLPRPQKQKDGVIDS